MGSVRSVTVPLFLSVLSLAGCGSAEETARAESAAATQRAEEQAAAELTAHAGVVVSGADIDDDAEEAESPAAVVVYEDFQCSYCKEVDAGVGDYLEERMEDGDITVEYRIVSFLDSASQNEYSSRAANAALCVFDKAGPGAFYEVREDLFDEQPDEGRAGPDDAALKEYASDAGADVGDCITNRTYDETVTTATQNMSRDGVTGTPTVMVDGEIVELDSGSAVEDAVEKAVD